MKITNSSTLIRVTPTDHDKIKAYAANRNQSITDVVNELAYNELRVPEVRIPVQDKVVRVDHGTHSLICEYAKRNNVTIQSALHAILTRGIQ